MVKIKRKYFLKKVSVLLEYMKELGFFNYLLVKVRWLK